jgi:hypothetical protein
MYILGILNPTLLLGLESEEDVNVQIGKNTKGQISFSISAKKTRGNYDEKEEEDDDGGDDDDDDRWGRAKKKKKAVVADTGKGDGTWKEIRFDIK